MTKLVCVSAILFLLISVASTVYSVDVDLVTGRNLTKIGILTVTDDGNYLYVTYKTYNGWKMTAIHLEVKDSFKGIPQSNGNPVPGKFTYKRSFLPVDTYVCDPFPITGLKRPLYVAAHADVRNCKEQVDTEAISIYPFGLVSLEIKALDPNGFAHFEAKVTGLGITGTYGAYCINVKHRIYDGTYPALVFSSYGYIMPGAVEIKENLDLINYILNKYYVGYPSPSDGSYGQRDIQLAIWALINTGINLSNSNPNHKKAIEIRDDALANGEGYVPPVGGYYGVILVPVDENKDIKAQPIIIMIPVKTKITCSCETAWAGTLPFPLTFPGRNWAIYFTYP